MTTIKRGGSSPVRSALLEVEEVVKRFGGIRAVDGATMRSARGR